MVVLSCLRYLTTLNINYSLHFRQGYRTLPAPLQLLHLTHPRPFQFPVLLEHAVHTFPMRLYPGKCDKLIVHTYHGLRTELNLARLVFVGTKVARMIPRANPDWWEMHILYNFTP